MASLRTIFRQIEREGARFGLFPVMRDGKVSVCERVREIDIKRGSDRLTHVVEAPRVVCSLDETSPMDAWASILKRRLSRHQHDYMKMVRAHWRRQREQGERTMGDLKRDIKARVFSKIVRGRQLFLPPVRG